MAPSGGGYGFDHHAAIEGFELDLGGAGLVARATPGHTPEHFSWELQDGDGRPTVWVLGDRGGADAAEHFDFLPTAFAFGIAGLVVWAYHSWIYNQVQAGRTEPVRILKAE